MSWKQVIVERLINYQLSRNSLHRGVSAVVFLVDLSLLKYYICGVLPFTLNKGRPCLWQWRFLPPTNIPDWFSNFMVCYPFQTLVHNVFSSLCQKHEHFIDVVVYWTAVSVTDLWKNRPLSHLSALGMGELCDDKKANLVGISCRIRTGHRGIVVRLPAEKNAH